MKNDLFFYVGVVNCKFLSAYDLLTCVEETKLERKDVLTIGHNSCYVGRAAKKSETSNRSLPTRESWQSVGTPLPVFVTCKMVAGQTEK